MRADDQAPEPDAARMTVLQTRLDTLFRHHDRDDAADTATAALREYIERYRLQKAISAGEKA